MVYLAILRKKPSLILSFSLEGRRNPLLSPLKKRRVLFHFCPASSSKKRERLFRGYNGFINGREMDAARIGSGETGTRTGSSEPARGRGAREGGPRHRGRLSSRFRPGSCRN